MWSKQRNLLRSGDAAKDRTDFRNFDARPLRNPRLFLANLKISRVRIMYVIEHYHARPGGLEPFAHRTQIGKILVHPVENNKENNAWTPSQRILIKVLETMLTYRLETGETVHGNSREQTWRSHWARKQRERPNVDPS